MPSKKPQPYYSTNLGDAFLGDTKEILPQLELNGKVDLIITSPPYALRRKKEYGNVDATEYVDWFMSFSDLFYDVLAPHGSLVINIGGSWKKGLPVRSLYHYELLISLCNPKREKFFYLGQDLFWYNPSKLPAPAEWVTVRRIRVKDAVECVWWLSKSPFPQANNRKVLVEYSDSMKELHEKGYKPKLRPSGHDISDKFSRVNGGAIPPNLLQIANTDSNSRYLMKCRENGLNPNPARYPEGLPEFFIDMLTEPGDLVLDPFAGSNVTGAVAERRGRRWISTELVKEYLEGSKFRFDNILSSSKKRIYQPTLIEIERYTGEKRRPRGAPKPNKFRIRKNNGGRGKKKVS